jgi:hypothetical protein
VESVTARREPWRLLTKRALYFFLFWLSPLVISTALFFELYAYVPFALVHSWNARHRSTPELLRSSWKVPFKFACWAAIQLQLLGAYDAYRWGAWPASSARELLSATAYYTACNFAGAAAHVAVGWLLLVTVASRLPFDNRHPVPSLSKSVTEGG